MISPYIATDEGLACRIDARAVLLPIVDADPFPPGAICASALCGRVRVGGRPGSLSRGRTRREFVPRRILACVAFIRLARATYAANLRMVLRHCCFSHATHADIVDTTGHSYRPGVRLVRIYDVTARSVRRRRRHRIGTKTNASSVSTPIDEVDRVAARGPVLERDNVVARGHRHADEARRQHLRLHRVTVDGRGPVRVVRLLQHHPRRPARVHLAGEACVQEVDRGTVDAAGRTRVRRVARQRRCGRRLARRTRRAGGGTARRRMTSSRAS